MNVSRKLYEFIVDEHERRGYVPSQSKAREVFSGMTEDVDLHLRRLASEGLIGLGVGDDDLISLPPTYSDARQIPLRTHLPVGLTQLDSACPERTIALNLRGAGIAMEGEYHAQIVTDDSMLDAGLMQGDIALMLEIPPTRGDIVAIEVEGKILLRRFVILSTIPHLLAENPIRPDLIPAWEHDFKGVLWGLIRTTPRPPPLATYQKVKVNYMTAENREPSEKDNLNRGSHLLMDKDDWRRAISCSQPTETHSKEKSERAAGSKRSRKKYKLPTPPPMMGLNDQMSSDYHSAKDKMILDERPDLNYHQALTDALESFAGRMPGNQNENGY